MKKEIRKKLYSQPEAESLELGVWDDFVADPSNPITETPVVDPETGW